MYETTTSRRLNKGNMMIDCHSHLDEKRMVPFLDSLRGGARSSLRVISNSVDIESSRRNLEISREFDSVSCFVGVHPEIFSDSQKTYNDVMEERIGEELRKLAMVSQGIGEIGLDPKYGKMESQRNLFETQLEVAESFPHLPLSIHSRGTLKEIMEILSEFQLRNTILFHWFSGIESELKIVNSKGYYVSFGLPILFSKRLSGLVRSADPKLLLAETDSPIIFQSLSSGLISPFAVSSVLFEMASILSIRFDDMVENNEENAASYLERKTH